MFCVFGVGGFTAAAPSPILGKTQIKKQGQESKRQSKTNTARFTVTTKNPVEQALKKQSAKEDLKRQSLPLRQEYFKRVQDYFNLNYDPLYQPDKL